MRLVGITDDAYVSKTPDACNSFGVRSARAGNSCKCKAANQAEQRNVFGEGLLYHVYNTVQTRGGV